MFRDIADGASPTHYLEIHRQGDRHPNEACTKRRYNRLSPARPTHTSRKITTNLSQKPGAVRSAWPTQQHFQKSHKSPEQTARRGQRSRISENLTKARSNRLGEASAAELQKKIYHKSPEHSVRRGQPFPEQDNFTQACSKPLGEANIAEFAKNQPSKPRAYRSARPTRSTEVDNDIMSE